jgi:uncharacterized protein involved in exopolysaccharide biosynthesis
MDLHFTGTVEEFRLIFASVADNALLAKVEELAETIDIIGINIEGIKMNQAELAQELASVTAQIAKVGTETAATLQKVVDLEALIQTAGNTVTQEVLDALAGLKAQAQLTDDLVPDVAPPPAP